MRLAELRGSSAFLDDPSPTPPAPLPHLPSGRGISWLDVKLGVRMLRNTPGLTVVAVVALSIGIPAILVQIHAPWTSRAPLPCDERVRIVAVEHFNIRDGRVGPRYLRDYFLRTDFAP